jgi:hypothetical protein
VQADMMIPFYFVDSNRNGGDFQIIMLSILLNGRGVYPLPSGKYLQTNFSFTYYVTESVYDIFLM